MNTELMAGESASGVSYWTHRRGSRPWLVLTHGAFADSSDFHGVVDGLAATHDLLLWDLPGHGASRAVAPCRRLNTAADHLLKIMQQERIETARLLGTSFGGMVSQRFAQLYPDQTSTLIACVCVPIFLTKMPAPKAVNLLARVQFAFTTREAFMRRFARQASIVPDVQEQLYRRCLTHSDDVRNSIWEAMIYGSHFNPGFRFRCPVAQITAEKDDRFPGAQASMRRWGEQIPPELRHEIPAAGHAVYLEQPETFLQVLQAILHNLDQLASTDLSPDAEVNS